MSGIIIMMRTTMNIDDDLLQELKHRAIDRNLSTSEFLNRVLRDVLLRRTSERSSPFRMVVYGPTEHSVHHEPEEFYDAIVDDDVSGLRAG